MNDFEARKICYESFGGFGLIAYKILLESVNHSNLHSLCKSVGASYKFVKDVVQIFGETNGETYKIKNLDFCKQNLLNFDFYKQKINAIVSQFSMHNKKLDHVSANVETLVKRAEYICQNIDTQNCKILFLGDHDFSSIALATILKDCKIDYSIAVVDIDDNVLNFVFECSKQYGLNITALHSDFRQGVANFFARKFDLIFSDPPYTPEGMALFLQRAIDCAKDKFSQIYLCYKTAELSPAIGQKVQKEMMKHQIYFRAILPDFNQYVAAEALGYRSDLYVCDLTPKCFEQANQNQSYNIYTHGSDSIEATPKIVLNFDDIVKKISQKYGFDANLFKVITDKQSKQPDKTISGAVFYRTKQNKNFNVSRQSIFLHDFTYQNADVLDLRTLIMSDKESQFAIFSTEQTKVLYGKKFEVITSLYNISIVFETNDYVVLRFDLKPDILNSTKSIMIYKNSSIKNAYTKLSSKFKMSTQNQAREEFSHFVDLQPYADCNVFDLPLDVLKILFKCVA